MVSDPEVGAHVKPSSKRAEEEEGSGEDAFNITQLLENVADTHGIQQASPSKADVALDLLMKQKTHSADTPVSGYTSDREDGNTEDAVSNHTPQGTYANCRGIHTGQRTALRSRKRKAIRSERLPDRQRKTKGKESKTRGKESKTTTVVKTTAIANTVCTTTVAVITTTTSTSYSRRKAACRAAEKLTSYFNDEDLALHAIEEKEREEYSKALEQDPTFVEEEKKKEMAEFDRKIAEDSDIEDGFEAEKDGTFLRGGKRSKHIAKAVSRKKHRSLCSTLPPCTTLPPPSSASLPATSLTSYLPCHCGDGTQNSPILLDD